MKVPLELTVTEPLVVVVEPVYVSESPSGSVALTVPVTTPVLVLGVLDVPVHVGAELVGLMVTVTGTGGF